MTGRNPSAGVALLETLIALLVMAMIAALVSGVTGGSIRGLARSAALGDELQQALNRRDLRQLIEHAIPDPLTGGLFAGFVGTQTGLTLQTVPSGGTFWPAVPTSVTVTETAQYMAQGQDENGQPVMRQAALAPEGQRITVLYWGRLAENQGNSWYFTWPAEAPLPGLVKITFSGPGRPVPPLIIRPAKAYDQSEMSLSSLVPPALPSAP